jgi:hypothetical protein
MTDLHSDELIGRYPVKALAITAGAILIVLGSVWALGYAMGQRKQAVATVEAENRANVAKGEADAHKALAQAKDAEITAKDDLLASARADVDTKTAALAKLRASIRNSQITNTPADDQPILAGPEYLDADNLIGISIKQDELIKAQADLIKQQDVKINTLLISRDEWKATSEAREREAAGLRIALEAQKSLTKGALWRGRFQGLAVGVASGYALGKFR